MEIFSGKISTFPGPLTLDFYLLTHPFFVEYRFDANFSDPAVWDTFVQAHAGPDGGLLQSWLWGEVQQAAGHWVRRIGLQDDQGALCAGWQIITHALPAGFRYWYVPRPVGNHELGIENYGFFLEQINKLARHERVVFLRVDGGAPALLEQLGFRNVPGAVQPLEELHVNIERTPDELIFAMKPKTRYNIGVAKRHGVTVEERPLGDEAERRTLVSLVQATAARQGIRAHPAGYYHAMGEKLGDRGHLLVASFQGNPLAAALLVSYHGVLTYVHGGSVERNSEVMPPYLLHWSAMELGQTIGCRVYNFGGVSSSNPGWSGLTRFKVGFSPNTKFVQYGGLQELPVRRAIYRFYRLAQTIRHPMT